MSNLAHPAARAETNPVTTLLLGAAVPAAVGVGVLALGAIPLSLATAASVLVGGLMAVVALFAGPVLHQLCRNVDPNLVLGLAVLAYFTVISLLWIGYSLVRDESWLIGGAAGAGVLVASVGWAAGQMRTARRLRQTLYQEDESTAGR